MLDIFVFLRYYSIVIIIFSVYFKGSEYMIKKPGSNFFQKAIIVIGVILSCAVLIPVILKTAPDIITIVKNEEYEQIELYLKSFGAVGVIVAVVIQILQVISVVIPSPLVWVSVGAVYGTFYGLLICAVGMVLGNGLVFFIARKFHLSRSEKGQKSFKFLSGIKNEDLMIFLMYIIPGMPNGIVPYICAGTKIPLKKFLTIVGVSCVPSILFSTCIGDMALQGNHEIALVILGLALILTIVLILCRKKIAAYFQKFSK